MPVDPPVALAPPLLVVPPVALAPPLPVPVVDSLFAHPSVAATTDAPSQHKQHKREEGILRIVVREVPSMRARGSKIHRRKKKSAVDRATIAAAPWLTSFHSPGSATTRRG